MCDPVTIAGAALSGAGMAANAIGSNQVQHANNAASQQTMLLNMLQQQRADQANAAALGEYQNFGAGQTARGAQLGDILTSATKTPMTPGQMAPTTSGNVAQAEGINQHAVDVGSQQQGRALGNVMSFGDYLGNVNRGAARDLQTADQATNFMKGNSNVLGYKLADAQHAGDTTGLLGNVASGLGGLGIKAGLSGGFGKLAGFFG